VDVVNAEKSKFFEEKLKLTNKVEELKRTLEKKSNEELGEGAEIDLFEALKAKFPDDNIQRIRKGSPGADIRHTVIMNGNDCGTILYDSKNHNQFRTEHVTKLKADQIADKAEHAILSTYKFPQGTRHVHVQDGVVLVSPARVVAIATIIRGHMTQIYTLRVSRVERESKMSELFEFIVSERARSFSVGSKSRPRTCSSFKLRKSSGTKITGKSRARLTRPFRRPRATSKRISVASSEPSPIWTRC
jgi:hypothetical protein